jgi:V/A-type H+-transporting ATPase subunit D
VAEPVPPGRAGRLWLLGRLAAAERSAELLDRKRQLLLNEQHRLALRRAETGRRWKEACADAERWGLRAQVLGGASAVAMSASSVAGRSDVELTWLNTMGVRHPGDARCTLAQLAPAEEAAANAAVAPAASAYRKALEAAAAHAVAETSWLLLDAELRTTRRRQRAIERHRLPVLRDALQQLELRLDELEREERVVARWARERRQGRLVGSGARPGPSDRVRIGPDQAGPDES